MKNKSKIIFCKKCVFSNKIVLPSVPTEDEKNQLNKERINFKDGICQACIETEKKFTEKTDWKEREKELFDILEKYRSKNGSFDCIVPGSGGKDSVFQAHILKTKYNMNPLTVTFAPHMYTDIGMKNFHNWPLKADVHNFLYTPSGKLHRKLTELAFKNLLHPFQPFIFGQRNYVVHMAKLLNIPLIFFGESQSEYGADQDQKEKYLFPRKYWTKQTNNKEILVSGLTLKQLNDEFCISENDLKFYLPISENEAIKNNIKVMWLGYFENFMPQENYYLATKISDFQPNDQRTEQTYSKYSSLDDKIDPFHYYTAYVKFGYGRCTGEASYEIRHKYITREEGVRLVHKYDNEFPKRYFAEFLKYINTSETDFYEILDSFRDNDIWEKTGNDWKYCKNWKLRHIVE